MPACHSQPACLSTSVCVCVFVRFECVFDCECDCIRVCLVLRILHYIIVQASRHSTAPPRVCVVSTSIHPSLIFVCARNTNGIVCVAHNNKNTRRRIHLSLTHTHTQSLAGWLSVKYTVHVNIHTDTSKERVISKQEHFWGRAFFFVHSFDFIPHV